MGYFETDCQFCGASPAIARIRAPHEPDTASWDYSGEGFIEAEQGHLCGEGSGCYILTAEGEQVRAGGDEFAEGEHIAGTGCVSGQGYSGWRISLEEMKGCRAIQCLVQKGDDWKEEADDEDWEKEGEYFLSGCGDGSADEAPLVDLQPIRHGLMEAWPFNTLHAGEDAAIPFHPTCFQIFKRVSLERLGKIDVHGFWELRTLGDWSDFDRFPRHPAIKNGKEQWWNHEPGHEWLAANPIEIPGLKLLLASCTQEFEWNAPAKRVPYDVNKGVFYFKHKDRAYHDTDQPPLASSTSDQFLRLPQELLHMVLSELSSSDVASLRLATPAVRQLPVIFFRGLLLREAPWLWEVRDMEIGTTNWYKMWCKLRVAWKDMKGLQNRRRIWKDVNENVRRIENYRQEGKIVDAGTELGSDFMPEEYYETEGTEDVQLGTD